MVTHTNALDVSVVVVHLHGGRTPPEHDGSTLDPDPSGDAMPFLRSGADGGVLAAPLRIEGCLRAAGRGSGEPGRAAHGGPALQ